jgi:hypothetical protein
MACAAWILFAVLAQPAAADVITIEVSEDTSPYSFLPSLPRYNNPTLYAFQTLDESMIHHDFETYLWFDVSFADVPVGHIVTAAYVAVTYGFDYTAFGDTSDEDGVLDCREILQSWNQTTLTWNNRPTTDLPFDTITEIDSFGSLICDATPVVQGWLYDSQPNHGIAMTSPTARVMGMYASEAAVAPALMPTLFLTTEVPEPAFGVGLAICVGVLAGSVRRDRARTFRSERV